MLGSWFSPRTTSGLTARYGLIAGLQEFAIWLPLPVLILHMTDRGLDLALIGLAFALRGLLVVLLEVPTGGLADAVGRKPAALWSQALTLASFVALLLLGGPATLLLYAVLQGAGAALHSGALDAWYVDALRGVDERVSLQRHLAVIDTLQSLGMLAAASLGGLLPALMSRFDLPWPLSSFGIALFAGIVARLLVWLLTALLVEERRAPGIGRIKGLAAVPEVLRDAVRLSRSLPAVPFLLLAAAASGAAMSALEALWQPLAALRVGGAAEGSAIFGGFGLLIGIAGLLGSLAVLRYGEAFPGGSSLLAALTQALKGAAMLALAAQAGPLGIGAALAFSYFALSANNVPHETLLNEAIPSERRSVMLSLNSMALFLGFAIGSAALGGVAAAMGPRWAMALAGAATAAASLSYVGVAQARRRLPLAKPS